MLSPCDGKSAGSGSAEYPTNRVYVLAFFCAAIFAVLILLLGLSNKVTLTSLAIAFFVALYYGGRLWDLFKRKPQQRAIQR